jgi:hypothetical protein
MTDDSKMPRLAVSDEVLPPAPRPTSELKSFPATPRANLRWESRDDYPAVVAVLDSKTRVIESSDRIQWIIQKHLGGRWRNKYFCRTKEGLLLYARPTTPELLALPDRFPEAASGPVTRNGGKKLNVTLKRATATSISATVSS